MFAISKEYVCVCCYGKRLNVGNVGSFQLLRERAHPFWCESSRIDSCGRAREYFRWDGEKVVLYPIFCARSIILRKSITIYRIRGMSYTIPKYHVSHFYIGNLILRPYGCHLRISSICLLGISYTRDALWISCVASDISNVRVLISGYLE